MNSIDQCGPYEHGILGKTSRGVQLNILLVGQSWPSPSTERSERAICLSMILHDSTKFILNLHEFACCIGYAFMARASRDQSGFQAACADPEPGSVILLENLSWRLKTQEQHIDFAIQHTIACRGILVRLFLEVILNSQSLCTRISH